jgi:hypothetical protein
VDSIVVENNTPDPYDRVCMKIFQIVLTSWSQGLIASIMEQRGSSMSQMVFVVSLAKLNWHT